MTRKLVKAVFSQGSSGKLSCREIMAIHCLAFFFFDRW